MAGYPYQRLPDTLLVPLQSVAESGRVLLRPRAAFVVLARVAPFAVGGLAFCVRVVFAFHRLIVTLRWRQEEGWGVRGTGRRLLPPPFRLDCRPERRERDAQLSGNVSPPNRPPPRLPRDRALRAGEHQPIALRWTLLCRPSMAGYPVRKNLWRHDEHAPRS